MEKDEAHQRRSSTTSPSQDKEPIYSTDDDSRKLEKYASNIQTELYVAKQVDALENQRSQEDSNIQLDSNSRTAPSNDSDESFEVISESSSSPESALNTRILLCITKEVDDLQNQGIPKDSIRLDSSSTAADSNDTDESFEVIKESSPESTANAQILLYNEKLYASGKSEASNHSISQLDSVVPPDSKNTDRSIQGLTSESSSMLEHPVTQEENFKISDCSDLLINGTSEEKARHQMHDHQKVRAEESESFVKEKSKEGNSVDCKQISGKSYKPSYSIRDGSVKLSNPMNEFASISSAVITEFNKQKNEELEDFKQTNGGKDIANVEQSITAGPNEEFIEAPSEDKPEKTVKENSSYMKTFFTSNIDQLAIHNSGFCKKTIESPSSSKIRAKERYGLTEFLHMLPEKRSQDAEHQKVKQEVNASLARDEENSLHHEDVNTKFCKLSESADDINVGQSIQKKLAFNSSTITVEHNEQNSNKTQNFKLENLNANTANVQLNAITDSRAEITVETLKKALDEIEEKVQLKTSSPSDIKKNAIQKPMLCKNTPGLPLMARTKEESTLTKLLEMMELSETSNEGTQKAFQLLKQKKLGEIANLSRIERIYACMEIKIGDGGSYYEVSSAEISTDHIIDVLKRMKSNHYLANGNESDLKMLGYCKYLFEKDYKVKVVNNAKGTLCRNYPARIIVPYANSSPSSAPKVLEEVTIQTVGATCRDRFVAPTIFWNGKFIYRSAPLMVKESTKTEGAAEPVIEADGDPGYYKRILKHVWVKSESFINEASKTAEVTLRDLNRRNPYKEDDEKSLEYCKVLQIVNLIADRDWKLWINLSSDENVFEVSRSEFNILQKPFPDSKFFRRYHEARRVPDGLLFDFSDVLDLVDITQTFMKNLITFFTRKKTNIVIHCITGWDQTPFFIALLRIALWADGLIHKSLNAQEMAYLTLAYDWYLFGHNLPARLKNGEEIMHYCYKFLEYFLEDEYSEKFIRLEASGANPSQRFGPVQRNFERIEKLNNLRFLVLPLYDEHILGISR